MEDLKQYQSLKTEIQNWVCSGQSRKVWDHPKHMEFRELENSLVRMPK